MTYELLLNFWKESNQYFRVGLYLLLSIEALFLAQLYIYAYKNIKGSRIIKALKWFLFWFGTLYLFSAFIPLIRIARPDLYELAVNTVALLLVPVVYWLREFRKESLKQQDTQERKKK